ncbi:MAG TPA: hypothetical protein VMV92_29050 [Streptosporangiaceae bacterium]|nr:hypothetical protein [Streptosporangiaceae bacterium]
MPGAPRARGEPAGPDRKAPGCPYRQPPSFYILLVIAGLIGAVGIMTNSQILVIGAMVVGPEYFAIIATALGLSKRDRAAVRESLSALLSASCR